MPRTINSTIDNPYRFLCPNCESSALRYNIKNGYLSDYNRDKRFGVFQPVKKFYCIACENPFNEPLDKKYGEVRHVNYKDM